MSDSKMLVWPTKLMTDVINVVLVGAGGNGSEVFDGLIKLHNALLCLGHEGGLRVTVIDPDIVSKSNVIRQKFLPYEVGQSKAISLAHKANILFGTQWEAVDELFPLSSGNGFGCKPDLIISCVDNYKARKSIYEYASRLSQQTLWMDLGNTNSSGQVVMGHIGGGECESKIENVVDLFPEILTAKDKENKASCSSVESITRQDLFINAKMANAAMNLLWKLIRNREIPYHGIIVDLDSFEDMPIAISMAEPTTPTNKVMH